MKTSLIKLIVMLLGLMAALPVIAQPPMHAHKRMETLKKMKLLEMLDLENDEANKFLVKYDSWSDKLKEKRKELDIAEDKLRLAIKEDKSNDELNKLADNFIAKQEEFHRLMSERIADFRTILSEKNFAILLVFEKEFPKMIQRKMMDFRQRRGRDR